MLYIVYKKGMETLTKEEFMAKFNINEMYEHYKSLMRFRLSNKKKNTRYRNSDKGIIATREASKRYYYRSKNKHHPIYNPIETEE